MRIDTDNNIDFYPRSPCGERRRGAANCYLDNIISIHALLAESDHLFSSSGVDFAISIHALLAESDSVWAFPAGCGCLFLSTLSLRRATLRVLDGSKSSIISIHALLAESDLGNAVAGPRMSNFYPRSPCGERRSYFFGSRVPVKFLSTLSLRRATSFRVFYWLKVAISIHALLAESDSFRVFYWLKVAISIHALLAESDKGT